MKTLTVWRSILVLATIGIAFPPNSRAQPSNLAPTQVRTFTYKQVGDLEIKADVHRPADKVKRPVLVWIHGGALIMGGRQGIDRRIKATFLEAGYIIVSIDYRLAPETRLPEIIEDLEDAFKWVRNEGPRLFYADVRRLAVAGGSAGGYLTLTAGFRVQPPPAVLVSHWGYGDLIGDWYSQPSPNPRHHRATMTEEEVSQFLSGPPVSNSRDRKGDGGAFYQYCRQQGLWPKLVSGFDPHTEAGRFNPFMPVKNVSSDFPPTLMIHGTDDTDVPYEQSVMMAQQLKEHGVPHRLITIRNGEHGLGGGSPKEIAQAYEAVLPFVRHDIDRKVDATGN